MRFPVVSAACYTAGGIVIGKGLGLIIEGWQSVPEMMGMPFMTVGLALGTSLMVLGGVIVSAGWKFRWIEFRLVR